MSVPRIVPEHKLPLSSQTVSQMVDAVLKLPEDTRVMILAPAVRERKGEFVDFFADLQAQGFARVRVDGEVYQLDEVPKLEKNIKHNIDVVIDRVKVKADIKQRLAESFETALRHGNERGTGDGNGQRRRTLVFRAFRLPRVFVQSARTRAASVFVQQPDGLLPDLRRLRQYQLLRSRKSGRPSRTILSRRRD